MARAPSTDVDMSKIPQAIIMLENKETKKAVCEFIGIPYNTTRLQKLIDTFIEDKNREAEQRKKRRGTAITSIEITNMIEAYLLDNEPISVIAKRFYRSEALIKYTLERNGVLFKAKSTPNPMKPSMLPEECIQEEFHVGETVWVPGYNCVGEIMKHHGDGAYRIYLLDASQHRYVNYMWWDIGSLKHIQALGVDLSKLQNILGKEERNALMREALKKVKQQKRED